MKFRRYPNQKFRSRKNGRNQSPNGSVLAAIRANMQPKLEAQPISVAQNESAISFVDFQISEQLKTNIQSKGYIEPTPIQTHAIPGILEGRDVIGIAHTGTGKTAAFLIPLIETIAKNKNHRVLIVTPTRELALQIGTELRDFSRGFGIRWAMVIGGVGLWRQQQDIRNGAHFVIGTPGRLKDLIQQRTLSLSQFRHVVLDEADRMVDIGFIGDIKYFISLLPKERQSLFFSATISGKVAEILKNFVVNPITVSVKKQHVAPNVDQKIIEVLNGKKKFDYLTDLLIKQEFDKVLIFGKTKWGVERLTDELTSLGFKAASIHGNKRQSQRQRILSQFKSNQIKILLATDVASRGLDIQDVSHVINYDLPESYEDYIHRIGRTGRGSKLGSAYTFIS